MLTILIIKNQSILHRPSLIFLLSYLCMYRDFYISNISSLILFEVYRRTRNGLYNSPSTILVTTDSGDGRRVAIAYS